MDESTVLGMINQEDCKGDMIKDYEEIKIDDLRFCTKEYEWQGKLRRRQVFSHPDLSYYLSPYLLGAVMSYMEKFYAREARLFAVKQKPYPFLVRALTLGEAYEGPAFFIAPTIFE